MAEHGMRAEEGGYGRRTILRNKDDYDVWCQKLSTVLDEYDCLRIVQEKELCPSKVLVVQDAARNVTNQAAMDENLKELKDFGRCYKKATSLITNSTDDKIVIMLKGLSDPIAIWKKVAADFNMKSDGISQMMKKDFPMFNVDGGESVLQIKHRFEYELEKCRSNGIVLEAAEISITQLDALDETYDAMKESYWNHEPLQSMDWIWARMTEKERTSKRRGEAKHAAALAFEKAADVYFEGQGGYRGGRGARGSRGDKGRGNGGARGGYVPGGGQAGGARDWKVDTCFSCGGSGHYAKDYPHKETVCSYCSGVGHLEKCCYDKQNGKARGLKANPGGAQGDPPAPRKKKEVKVGEVGHGQQMVAEICRNEEGNFTNGGMWLADTIADKHVTGNLNIFVGELSQLPPGYFVMQVQGEVPINLKGLVRIISVDASGNN